MKKIIISLAFFIPLLSQAQKSHSVRTYEPEMVISLTGGIQKNTSFEVSSAIYGAEISLQCPLVKHGKGYVRQNFKFTHQQDEKLKSTTIEINPQYMVIAKPDFRAGIGPSVGLIFADIQKDRKTIFSYGAGANATYYINKISIGVGAGYSLTGKVTHNDFKEKMVSKTNLNNFRTFLLLGYRL